MGAAVAVQFNCVGYRQNGDDFCVLATIGARDFKARGGSLSCSRE